MEYGFMEERKKTGRGGGGGGRRSDLYKNVCKTKYNDIIHIQKIAAPRGESPNLFLDHYS